MASSTGYDTIQNELVRAPHSSPYQQCDTNLMQQHSPLSATTMPQQSMESSAPTCTYRMFSEVPEESSAGTLDWSYREQDLAFTSEHGQSSPPLGLYGHHPDHMLPAGHAAHHLAKMNAHQGMKMPSRNLVNNIANQANEQRIRRPMNAFMVCRWHMRSRQFVATLIMSLPLSGCVNEARARQSLAR